VIGDTLGYSSDSNGTGRPDRFVDSLAYAWPGIELLRISISI